MKKFTFLLITLLMAFAFDGWGQVFITELADPNNNAEARFIELYNAGSSAVVFTDGSGWRIDKYTNASTTVSQTLDLTGTIPENGFYIIAYDNVSGTFQSVYGFAPDQLDPVSNGVAGGNGDDNYELYDGTNTLIDQFGVPGEDGSGTNHEFEDGRAERKATVTSGNTTYDFSEWNIWNDTGGSGTINDPQDAPDDFDPGEWIGADNPIITVSPSSLIDFSYVIGSGPSAEQSFTAEGANLTADITITPPTNYEISTGTGGSFVATNPITLSQSGGTVSTTTIYTRLKAGLSSGDYNNEEITAVSSGANDKTVTCSGIVFKLEPSNHVTAFTATTNNSSTIDLSWTENDGTVVSDGYLIIANTGTITDPIDGIDPTDDTDLTDGSGNVKVAHGTTSYSFTNCSSSTTYNFSIYPYTNSGTSIDFKTIPSAPTDAATTNTAAAEPSPGDLIITEVSGDGVNGNNSDDNGFMEIYNISSVELSLANVSARYYNSNPGDPTQTVDLSGSIAAGGFVIVTQNATNFQTEYGIAADYSGSQFYFNGGDDGCDIYHATNGILDQFNDNGTGQSPWTWNDDFSWDRNSSNSGATQSNWTANTTGTPKLFGLAVWTGGASTSWTDDDNWTFIAPSSTSNATIPTGLSNYPTLTATGPVCNNILIESDASLVGVDNLLVNGTATVDRSINGWTGSDDGFHFLSSPVASFAIAGSDFEPVNGTDDFYEWDETTATWLNYFDSFGDTEFVVGKGYLVAYSPGGTGIFHGNLNMDPSVNSLSFTSDEGEGWNLLGNPYISAIDWDLLTKSGGVDGSVYVIRGTDNAYVSWNENSQTGDLTDGHIPINNGFFVKAGSTGQSITMDPADQVHGSSGFLKKGNKENPDHTLKVSIANTEFVNNTYIQFRADASLDFDHATDAYKLFGESNAPQLFTSITETEYSINCLPFSSEEIQLPMGFRNRVASEYTISASGFESFPDQNFEIFLEDTETEDLVNLETNDYTFTAEGINYNDRFILHFYGVTSVDEPIATTEAQIYAAGKTVYIRFNNLTKGDSQVEVFNTIGQQVYNDDLTPQRLSYFRLHEKPGIYIVRLRTENGLITQKVMIK